MKKIIFSHSEINTVLDLVSVVSLSINLIDDAEPLRVRISKKEKLEYDSDAMIEQLRSVSKSRIGKKIASLSKEELEKINYGIKAMLALE
ncbi:PemK-like protein [Aliarcobacter thereius]|uniref:PemK-like protein n=1 Tax=Aliarcobacter thereius TaxID=544718 RepID=A0A1C0BA76_9BACT|nr:type II toxin-antitoxin system PemK/MazF family toxin [Aliarcobacter thereius]OCM00494.1 PemK-like protein [Aliarcobacter thereius]